MFISFNVYNSIIMSYFLSLHVKFVCDTKTTLLFQKSIMSLDSFLKFSLGFFNMFIIKVYCNMDN